MVERVHDIVGIEIDNDKDNRFVEITAVTKYGNKVVLNLDNEMWAMMLLFLRDNIKESEEINND